MLKNLSLISKNNMFLCVPCSETYNHENSDIQYHYDISGKSFLRKEYFTIFPFLLITTHVHYFVDDCSILLYFPKVCFFRLYSKFKKTLKLSCQ